MNGLACTICGRSAFAKLRLEISIGAATYLVCPRRSCIDASLERARDNLYRAAARAGVASRVEGSDPFPEAIDVDEVMPLGEIRSIEGA